MKVEYANEIKKVNALIYGKSGVGKTPIAATAPKPIFLDVEKRMITVSGKVARIPVSSLKEAKKALKFIKKEGNKYQTVVVDSLTQLVETRLLDLKAREKKAIKAGEKVNAYAKYDTIYDETIDFIEALKDMEQNIICVCRQMAKSVDDEELYRPSMSGQKLPPALPYLFDIVMAFIPVDVDEDDEDAVSRVLLTKPSSKYEAKSPDKLDKLEVFDMSKIFNKLLK